MKRFALIILLLLSLLLVSAQALAKPADVGYKMDWYVPFSGVGGGESVSANFRLDCTIGQTVVGVTVGSGNTAQLGFWSGLLFYRVMVPRITK